eukprot:bmy_08111T0
MNHGYTGKFEIIDDHRAGEIVVNLTGRLNNCGVISPRFDVQLKDLEKRQNNVLPSHHYSFQMDEKSIERLRYHGVQFPVGFGSKENTREEYREMAGLCLRIMKGRNTP